jgi:osmotically-inducible protein OsmY
MADIVLNAEIAKVVARILRSQSSGSPKLDAFQHALGEIVMSATAERAPADTKIRTDIVEQLNASDGLRDSLIDIGVHHGVVELRGVVPSDGNRNILCALASRTNGVTAVHDHLIWIDPRSGVFLPSSEDSYPG